MATNTTNASDTGGGDFQKDKEANQVRFEEDVEFVQSLANPHFVQELTLNGNLRSETMVKLSCGPLICTLTLQLGTPNLHVYPALFFPSYLQYLKYFHAPSYARFVRYPNALKILDLLNSSEQFRTMIETKEHAQLLTDKFIQNWISLSGRLNKKGPAVVKEVVGDAPAV